MELSGVQAIAARREVVWAALNDPKILQHCIQGCEAFEKLADDQFSASVRMKVGPVQALFHGTVTLSEMQPPASYRITGKGEGGVAGFARGSAEVTLAEAGDHTVLTYQAKADVSGRMAQIGSRLIQSTAQKYANDFFVKFNAVVTDGLPAAEIVADQPAVPPIRVAARAADACEDLRAHIAHLRRLNWALLALSGLLALALLV